MANKIQSFPPSIAFFIEISRTVAELLKKTNVDSFQMTLSVHYWLELHAFVFRPEWIT